MNDFWSVVSERDLRIGKTLQKITHKSTKNMGSTPILTNLVGVHPRNIHKNLKQIHTAVWEKSKMCLTMIVNWNNIYR